MIKEPTLPESFIKRSDDERAAFRSALNTGNRGQARLVAEMFEWGSYRTGCELASWFNNED